LEPYQKIKDTTRANDYEGKVNCLLADFTIYCRLDELCRLDKKLSRLKKPAQNAVYIQKAALRIRHNHAITS
jgi:hypothetical protein